MSESAKDIQLLKLKDTITQLNNLIKNQSEIMAGLQKTIDNLRLELSNKQSEFDYCKRSFLNLSKKKSTSEEMLNLTVIVFPLKTNDD